MPSDITHVFVPFADVVKSTVQGADGKDHEIRLVKGLMTDESLDIDKQIVDFDFAKDAGQRWHSRWGNVREQHGHNAIGKSVELEVLEAQRALGLISKVVDPLAMVKLDEGILQGYSVGIRGPRIVKDAKAPGGRIIGGEIIEVSLVDHPANENCKVALVKAAKSGKLVDAEQTVIEKIADPDEIKLADTDVDKTTTITITTDEEVQVTEAGASATENPLDGTAAEPEAARVQSAVDADLGGSLNPVAPTGDKSATPQITKSEEDADMLYAKAFTEVKDLLTKGDTNAALAVIQATEILTKKVTTEVTPDGTTRVWTEKDPEPAPANPTEAKVEVKVASPETPTATELTETIGKAATSDLLKATISAEVTKAVQAAVTQLTEKVEAMEKRAAPGGPLLSGTKLLSAPDEIKAAAMADRVKDLQKMADEHPDGTIRQGARQILAELEKGA